MHGHAQRRQAVDGNEKVACLNLRHVAGRPIRCDLLRPYPISAKICLT
jgi:hypothetical protein